MTQLYLVGFPVNETDAIDRFFDARRDKPPGWQRTQNVEEADVFLINARDREPDECFRAFRNNNWVGMAIFAGLAVSYAMAEPTL